VATKYQVAGDIGEEWVKKRVNCPRCRDGKLKILPKNFKCADMICDFCGFLGQVKSVNVKNKKEKLRTILGAAWKPQSERMKAGVYHSVFIVKLVEGKPAQVLMIRPDAQKKEGFFKARKPLSPKAKRAGWQGFIYDLRVLKPRQVEVLWER
jgi:type II restriction enzyme